MTGLRFFEASMKCLRPSSAVDYVPQLELYAHAAGISPTDALIEIHDEPMPRRVLMVGQQLRGSSKSMTGLLMAEQAMQNLWKLADTPFFPWHPDEGSWSEFLRTTPDPVDCTLPEIRDDTENGLKVRQWQPAEYRGPAVPVGVDSKRVARDRKKAKLVKASRKRNR